MGKEGEDSGEAYLGPKKIAVSEGGNTSPQPPEPRRSQYSESVAGAGQASQSTEQSERSEPPTLPDKCTKAQVESTPTTPKQKRGRPLVQRTNESGWSKEWVRKCHKIFCITFSIYFLMLTGCHYASRFFFFWWVMLLHGR